MEDSVKIVAFLGFGCPSGMAWSFRGHCLRQGSWMWSGLDERAAPSEDFTNAASTALARLPPARVAEKIAAAGVDIAIANGLWVDYVVERDQIALQHVHQETGWPLASVLP